ncbi:Mn2+/Fe2+ NRAMP family transporter [Pseudomonas migulae]|uniref:hypothetical protein n=1 Tax=Pseudomonas migulae TaxID=78543 RepID=UPI00209F0D93|nr:hypothetical protein [Pseudomonas migulae]MCP1496528.1 Mn2+/Fe2+ NRAMP family transporter [Pseudomonas migulae]
MSPTRIALLLLMTASTIALTLAGGSASIGVWIYVVVVIAAITLSRARPDGWPGRLFEVSKPLRTALTQRLLTQLAALVCLLSAQCLSGNLSDILSVAGVLLFVHTLVLARLPRIGRTSTNRCQNTPKPLPPYS